MLGFYGGGTGHHSGGISLNQWCQSHNKNPLDLYIAWVKDAACFRCAEIELHWDYHPSLNKIRPSKCRKHSSITPNHSLPSKNHLKIGQ
jgi:hypothetical protein